MLISYRRYSFNKYQQIDAFWPLNFISRIFDLQTEIDQPLATRLKKPRTTAGRCAYTRHKQRSLPLTVFSAKPTKGQMLCVGRSMPQKFAWLATGRSLRRNAEWNWKKLFDWKPHKSYCCLLERYWQVPEADGELISGNVHAQMNKTVSWSPVEESAAIVEWLLFARCGFRFYLG